MAKGRQPATSPAEMEILRLLWQLGEGTVQQICDVLPPERDIAYKTVLTLLGRLENKRYVKHRTKGRAHVFYPTVKRDAVVKRTVLEFVDRLFGGDPKPLMQFLAENGHIDRDDIEKLRRIVEKS